MTNKKKNISFIQAMLTGIGIVIGSGIFFRADNILTATEGNTLVAILSWIFIGMTLIFAGITISVLASRTKRSGGFSAYAEDTYGRKMGYIVGWFQVVIYAPAIIGILAIIATTYIVQLFQIDLSITGEYLLALFLIIAVFAWNMISTRIGAYFSSVSTVIKLIPLFLIAILGMLFGDPAGNVSSDILLNFQSSGATTATLLALFVAPMLSMAFAFDGWISIGALSEDLEKPDKQLPKIFIINMIVITTVYVVYFAGISFLMPPEQIIALGDEHVGVIAGNLFGPNGMKIILIFVIISVLGTLNGNVMAVSRYVESLGVRKMIPKAEFFAKRNETTGTPMNAFYLAAVTTAIFFVLYFSQSALGAFQGIAFDDLPIVLNAIFYLFLFVAVIRLGMNEKIGFVKTWIAPIIAILGQLLIIGSFFITNDKAFLYLIVSVIVILIGLAFYRKESA